MQEFKIAQIMYLLFEAIDRDRSYWDPKSDPGNAPCLFFLIMLRDVTGVSGYRYIRCHVDPRISAATSAHFRQGNSFYISFHINID